MALKTHKNRIEALIKGISAGGSTGDFEAMVNHLQAISEAVVSMNEDQLIQLLQESENQNETLTAIAECLKDTEDNTLISLLLLISQHTATIKDNTLAMKEQNNLLSVASFWGKIPAANTDEAFQQIRLINEQGAYEKVIELQTKVMPSTPEKRGYLMAQLSSAFAADVKIFDYLDSDTNYCICFANVPLFYYDTDNGNYINITKLQITTSGDNYDFNLVNVRRIAQA